MSTHKNSRALWLVLGLLVMLAVACGGSTGGTDDQAASLAATQAALAATQQAIANQTQPTDAPDEPAEAEPTEAPAYYTEEFDGDISLWTYFWTSGEEDDFAISNADGNLIFDISGKNSYSYLTYDAYFYEDVRLDTRARNLGSNNNNVSLVCRESDLGWYEFNVANNGLYWIYLYDQNDGGYKELYSGGSTAIKTGKDVNEYTVICDGDQLSLYINGTLARTVTNTFLTEGRVGVSVSSFDFVPVLVHFEWVTISEP